ncbi:hypothetical protein ACOME3_007381 [Neoechinorhynchus agilis]
MSDKDTLIQLEHTNRVRLEQLLQLIVDTLDVDQNELDYLESVVDEGFKDDQVISSSITIANKVLTACRVVFPDSLEQNLAAIRDTKLQLTEYLNRIIQKIYYFLSDQIRKSIAAEDIKPVKNEKDSPHHRELFAHICKYSELCKWLKVADIELVRQLSKVFKMSLAPIYDKEISKFIELAKTVASNEYGQRKVTSGSVTMDGVFRTVNKQRSDSLTLSSKSMDPLVQPSKSKSQRQSISKIMRKTLDNVLESMKEQHDFFVDFFGMNDDPNESQSSFLDDFQESFKCKIDQVAAAPTSSSSSDQQRPLTTSSIGGSMDNQSLDKSSRNVDTGTIGSSSGGGSRKGDIGTSLRIRSQMAGVFTTIGTELQSLLFYLISLDHFNCIYLFEIISAYNQKTLTINNYFGNKTIAGLLIIAKRAVDRYAEEVCGAISQYKITRNRAVGILPFVNFFQEFVDEAESIFALSSRRVDLDRVYAKIIHTIFQKIESAANIDNYVVPGHLICIENYHQLQHVLRLCKVQSFEGDRKLAEERYLNYKALFVDKYFGKPFKGMYIFFDKIEQKIEAGIRPSDIQFQNDLSVAHLKRLIRENPWSEVVRSLDSLHRQLQQQISNNSSLSQVIWHDLQELLIVQYRHYCDMMHQCYPDSNVRLNFSEADIVEYFTSSNEFTKISDNAYEDL